MAFHQHISSMLKPLRLYREVWHCSKALLEANRPLKKVGHSLTSRQSNGCPDGRSNLGQASTQRSLRLTTSTSRPGPSQKLFQVVQTGCQIEQTRTGIWKTRIVCLGRTFSFRAACNLNPTSKLLLVSGKSYLDLRRRLLGVDNIHKGTVRSHLGSQRAYTGPRQSCIGSRRIH